MTGRLATWGLALVGSALLHLGGYLWVKHQFTARPIPPQPTVTSQMSVQSEPVRQTAAKSGDASGEATPDQPASGQSLAAGTVPLSTARPVVATVTPLRDVPDAATPVAAASPSANPVAAATPTAAQLAASTPPSAPANAAPLPTVATAAAVPPTATLVATTSQTTLLVSTAAPLTPSLAAVTSSPAPLPVAAAPSTPAALITTPSTALSDAPAPSETLVVQRPPAEAITAELAFMGASQDIDAQSLAAFQSFTRPGDLQAEGDPLRDGVARILSQVPCARLQVEFDPDTATLALRGHVPDANLKAPVLDLLQQQMGGNIAVSDQMALLPRPQCGTLQAIENVGLPQSTDQITNPALLGADTHVRVFDFRAGDLLFLDLTGPDYPAFVYVDYMDAGGNVLHLSPNEHAPLIELSPAQPFSVGARAGQTKGLQLVIAPPFGQEIVVAFAASHPINIGPRPLVEPAGPYLEALKSGIATARAAIPDFKGEWVYFLVSTGP
ncbi:DUF4384 domain-containing protein [Epibacterium sp. SM1979]|uniref:DUF4384 domain-containing protein n=1 Tax=Tritonibacter litoralis TaxID=2662264 RepID=A0A843YLG5_9RHOB|nr:DUF4384 domain-containing protein [Tritonibacter litoralis]MQQ10092.1 DUF4384 domain-containing protein [Tritonibacter litoralis]